MRSPHHPGLVPIHAAERAPGPMLSQLIIICIFVLFVELVSILEREGLTVELLSVPCDHGALMKIAMSLDVAKIWLIATALELTEEDQQVIINTYSDDDTRKAKVLIKWKEQNGQSATYCKLLEVFRMLNLNKALDAAMSIIKCHAHQSQPLSFPTQETELQSMYPGIAWNLLSEEEQARKFYELQDGVERVCKAFNDLTDALFMSFQEQEIDLERLKVFINSFCNASLDMNPQWLEKLENCKNMAELFIFISNHSLWLCPTLLEAIVEKFGNEDDKKNLKKYQDEVLKPYLETTIKECRGYLLTMPSGTEHKQVRLKITNDTMDRVKITGHHIPEIKRKICKKLGRAPGSLELRAIRDGCVELVFTLPEEDVQECLSNSAWSDKISWDDETSTGYLNFDIEKLIEDAQAQNEEDKDLPGINCTAITED